MQRWHTSEAGQQHDVAAPPACQAPLSAWHVAAGLATNPRIKPHICSHDDEVACGGGPQRHASVTSSTAARAPSVPTTHVGTPPMDAGMAIVCEAWLAAATASGAAGASAGFASGNSVMRASDSTSEVVYRPATHFRTGIRVLGSRGAETLKPYPSSRGRSRQAGAGAWPEPAARPVTWPVMFSVPLSRHLHAELMFLHIGPVTCEC